MIKDDDIDTAIGQRRQPLLAARHMRRHKATPRQRLLHQGAEGGVVIDVEHPDGAADLGSIGHAAGLRYLDDGQEQTELPHVAGDDHPEGRPRRSVGANGDIAAEPSRQGAHMRQPDALARPVLWPRAEEQLEDALVILRLDAAAIIRHLDLHHHAGRIETLPMTWNGAASPKGNAGFSQGLQARRWNRQAPHGVALPTPSITATDTPPFAPRSATATQPGKDRPMGRSLLLWLLGVPIPIILLIMFLR